MRYYVLKPTGSGTPKGWWEISEKVARAKLGGEFNWLISRGQITFELPEGNKTYATLLYVMHRIEHGDKTPVYNHRMPR